MQSSTRGGGEVGIDGADLHSLRHTHTTMLQEAGVDSEVIRQRDGHSDIGMTRNYMHGGVETQRAAVTALERVLAT